MYRDMEEIYNEGVEQAKRDTVLALAEMKMPIEQIAQAVKVTIEVVQSWLGEDIMSTK